jgi:uncharacterized protein
LDWRAVRYLILILAWRCNLRCPYCYNGESGDAEASPELLEELFQKLRGGAAPLLIQLTGGEPLMAPERLFQAARAARELARADGRKVTVALQTNGTLLSRGALLELKRWGVQIGVSLDGPPFVQEEIRGGARETTRGLELMKELGIFFNVTSVVTEANVSLLSELALFLGGYPNARGFGLDLLTLKGRGKARPADPEALEAAARELKRTLLALNSKRERPLASREINLLAETGRRGGRKDFCAACRGASLAVTPEGELYPCGQAAGVAEFSMGTLASPTRAAPLGETLAGPQCASCPVAGSCPGECPGRLIFNGATGRELACALYRGLF